MISCFWGASIGSLVRFSNRWRARAVNPALPDRSDSDPLNSIRGRTKCFARCLFIFPLFIFPFAC